MSALFHGVQSCAARALRLLDTASGHWPAPPQRQWGVSVRRGRRGRAEENPLPLRQPGAPLPAASPPPRQWGAEPLRPFGHFRRALGSFRVPGRAGRAPSGAGALPVRARCSQSRGGPPLPPDPAPVPAPPTPPSLASVGGGGDGCRDWNPPAGARRRRREEGGQEGSGCAASVRARRESYSRARGDRAGAAARPGRRPSRAPALPRRLAAPTPLRAEGCRMSSPGSG